MELSVKDMCERYKVSHTTIGRWVKSGVFPKPTNRPGKPMAWPLSEVESWELDNEVTGNTSVFIKEHNELIESMYKDSKKSLGTRFDFLLFAFEDMVKKVDSLSRRIRALEDRGR